MFSRFPLKKCSRMFLIVIIMTIWKFYIIINNNNNGNENNFYYEIFEWMWIKISFFFLVILIFFVYIVYIFTKYVFLDFNFYCIFKRLNLYLTHRIEEVIGACANHLHCWFRVLFSFLFLLVFCCVNIFWKLLMFSNGPNNL